MKTLNLSTHTRIILISKLSGLNNLNLQSLNHILKVIERVSIKEDEAKRVNLREEKDEATGNILTRWDRVNEESGEELDVPVDIELSDDQAKTLEKILEDMGEKESLSIQDRPLLEVYEQLRKL